jgi:integrase
VKLTSSSIAALTLPEGKTDYVAWDDAMPGFGVRLRGAGKHFIVQYRVGKQQRRESLGDVRKITLDQARQIARQRFAQVELGNDPAAEKAKAREAASAAALTLGSVVTRYIDAKRDTVRRATFEAIVRHLNVLFAPLHRRPLSEIKRAEIAAQLQQIIKDSGRTCAARARSNLGALYTWAMREGLCEANPVIGTNDPDPKTSRDRVLSDSELVSVWNGCGDGNFAKIVRLLILTGCRRREIGSLKWSEIDLATGIMTISAERTKNGRAHTLTLPPMALDIIGSVPRSDGCDYVFGQSGFQRWSGAAHIGALREELGEMAHWSLHDLRRTFRTGLGRLGIPSHIAELCINHTRGGIEAVYDRHTYEREIALALAQWAAHVAAIIDGRPASNVTALRRA